jgi:hypothetical protein
MSRTNALLISPAATGAALTAPQRRFGNLIRQIGQARQLLATWHERIGEYRQAHGELLLPLETELTNAHRQWAFALDGLLAQRSWTKAEREMLRNMLCDTVGKLLANNEDDAPLKALFAKHAGADFDTERREMLLAVKELTEAITGFDLGDDEGLDTHADLVGRMHQKLREEAAAQETLEAQEANRSAKAGQRRKSTAQQGRETAAQQALQSMREIYRKLASALHPDRETDDSRREEKTALMQRVNQAYAANDLLALLELQLEIEQIDASHIATTSEQRLKHYNKVLGEQLAELRRQIGRVETGFRIEFGLEHVPAIQPHKLGQVLDQVRRELHAELTDQQRVLRMLDDTEAVKRWLKRERQQLRSAKHDFMAF